VTNPLFQVLVRTLVASTLSEACVLETSAHGTVVIRAGFVRREVLKDVMPGELAIITGEPVATIAEVDAPDTQAGDLVFIDGRLHNVRSALAEGGGTMKLQLALAQRTTIDLADDYIEVAVVGDPDGSAHVVALAPAGVLRRSDLVSMHGDAYRVGTPTDWPAGGLRRYVLTPA